MEFIDATEMYKRTLAAKKDLSKKRYEEAKQYVMGIITSQKDKGEFEAIISLSEIPCECRSKVYHDLKDAHYQVKPLTDGDRVTVFENSEEAMAYLSRHVSNFDDKITKLAVYWGDGFLTYA